MTNIYETKVNNYIYEYQQATDLNQKTRPPLRKRVIEQEVFVPGTMDYLYQLFTGKVIQLHDIFGKVKVNMKSKPLIFYAANQYCEANDVPLKKFGPELKQLTTSIKVNPTIEDDGRTGFTLVFLNVNEKNETGSPTILCEYKYVESEDTLETLIEMINAIEDFARGYYQWAADAVHDPKAGLKNVRSNPMYDMLAFSYFLRIVSKTRESIEPWVLCQLSMRQTCALESCIGLLLNGSTIHEKVIDAYCNATKKTTLLRSFDIKTQDGNTNTITRVEIFLYGSFGIAFPYQINLPIRPKREPLESQSVIINAKLF